jgi:hypothetical protein
MADIDLRSSVAVPPLTASFAYRAVPTMGGASQSVATLFMAELTNENEISVFYLNPGNTVLTKEMLNYDLIVSVNAGPTSVEVPPNSIFGWTWVSGREPQGFFQRRGAGPLAINFPDVSVTLLTDNDVNIASLGPYHRPVRLNGVSVNNWTMD